MTIILSLGTLVSADVLRLQLTKLLAQTQLPSHGLRRRVRRWTLRYPKRSIIACAIVAGALTAFLGGGECCG